MINISIKKPKPVLVMVHNASKGLRGVGLSGVTLDKNGNLIFTMSDGTVQTIKGYSQDLVNTTNEINNIKEEVSTMANNAADSAKKAKETADSIKQEYDRVEGATNSGLALIERSVLYGINRVKEATKACKSDALANIELAHKDAIDDIAIRRLEALQDIAGANAAAVSSAAAAKTSETNAETSNQMAKKWAESTESPDGATDSDSSTGNTQSSKSWALHSKSNASAAKVSETNAKTSETNASKSATAAKVSETNAKGSETASAISEANAKTSESNAASSASSASDSEAGAATQASNAAKSATSASSYASSAKTSEANAKLSETHSASSASSASTSASNAKTSETNAKTSETNAGASATTAKNWAVSETSPDGATDTSSGTGKTQSSRTWALESKASAQSASSSANTATTQASSATASAKSASTSATSASDSATSAASSATAAKNSATAAAMSEQNAKASQSAAAMSEQNAKTSETNAAASKSAAANSASTAGTQANTAKAWATATTSPDGAADTASTTGKTQSAKSWALYSKDRATAAASSASAAADSASAAKTSETNAASSKTAAANSAKAAAGSATAAASSASSASTSATNAKAAMNTANTAASSASTSATSASTSASNAAKAEVAAKTAQAAAEKARDDANTAVNKLTGAMKYAGQVDNYSDLSDVTKNTGDVWNIVNADPEHGIKAGDNVVWNGTDWDDLSGTVDLSIYAEKADYQKVITSATANGATITFNYKDGTTSTATVNNVASATAATNDAKGQRIDSTYEKVADASNVHTSLQNSINSLSTSKQDKLTFDLTPTADSSNPVTSSGIKTALDGKPSNTGAGASGTWPISVSGNASTATKATNDGNGNPIASTYLPLSGGTLTGVVNGVTPPNGDNSKKLATTEFVNANATQADWNVTDSTSKAFVKNKPEVVTYKSGAYKEVLEWEDNCIQSVVEALATDHPNAYNYGLQVTLGKIGQHGGANAKLYFPHNDGLYLKNSFSGGNSTGWLRMLDTKNFSLYALPKNGIAVKATGDAAGNDIQNTYAKKSDLASSVSTKSLTVTGTTTVTGGLTVEGTITGNLTGNADTATKATNDGNGNPIASTYLPLSGGTLTGVVNGVTPTAGDNSKKLATTEFVANTYATKRDVANTYLDKLSKTEQVVTAPIKGTLNGNASSATKLANARTINVQDASASNTGTGASFDGSGNATIKLPAKIKATLTGNADTATKATNDGNGNPIASTYLPLSGGTITGSIKYVNNGKAFKIGNTTAGNVDIGWNYDNKDGAGIGLRSTDYASSPGEFVLFARDAHNTCTLNGKPDGSLTWNSQPLLPVGIVQAFAGTTIPKGWLLCDGSAVSRTTYASLYACIGTTYGSGNGYTTFNLPKVQPPALTMRYIIKY